MIKGELFKNIFRITTKFINLQILIRNVYTDKLKIFALNMTTALHQKMRSA